MNSKVCSVCFRCQHKGLQAYTVCVKHMFGTGTIAIDWLIKSVKRTRKPSCANNSVGYLDYFAFVRPFSLCFLDNHYTIDGTVQWLNGTFTKSLFTMFQFCGKISVDQRSCVHTVYNWWIVWFYCIYCAVYCSLFNARKTQFFIR
jgi:hypothetical protein